MMVAIKKYKKCTMCNKTKPLSEFREQNARNLKTYKECIDCRTVYPWWIATEKDKKIIDNFCKEFREPRGIGYDVTTNREDPVDAYALDWLLRVYAAANHRARAVNEKQLRQWEAYAETINAAPQIYPYTVNQAGITFSVVLLPLETEQWRLKC